MIKQTLLGAVMLAAPFAAQAQVTLTAETTAPGSTPH